MKYGRSPTANIASEGIVTDFLYLMFFIGLYYLFLILVREFFIRYERKARESIIEKTKANEKTKIKTEEKVETKTEEKTKTKIKTETKTKVEDDIGKVVKREIKEKKVLLLERDEEDEMKVMSARMNRRIEIRTKEIMWCLGFISRRKKIFKKRVLLYSTSKEKRATLRYLKKFLKKITFIKINHYNSFSKCYLKIKTAFLDSACLSYYDYIKYERKLKRELKNTIINFYEIERDKKFIQKYEVQYQQLFEEYILYSRQYNEYRSLFYVTNNFYYFKYCQLSLKIDYINFK
jgi:hypothetical protein